LSGLGRLSGQAQYGKQRASGELTPFGRCRGGTGTEHHAQICWGPLETGGSWAGRNACKMKGQSRLGWTCQFATTCCDNQVSLPPLAQVLTCIRQCPHPSFSLSSTFFKESTVCGFGNDPRTPNIFGRRRSPTTPQERAPTFGPYLTDMLLGSFSLSYRLRSSRARRSLLVSARP
jgi:hypothetical protein